MVNEVASDQGLLVSDYPELVRQVAKISYYNPSFNLFFRGQHVDHMIRPKSGDHRSSIYPSIFRPPKHKTTLHSKIKQNRFDRLDTLCSDLVDQYRFPGRFTRLRVKSYQELQWSILQHYQKCKTPLIDITQSLRVAASFCILNNDNQFGYLYIFALPNVNGSISYFVDENIVLAKLQSICPPQALRAHFQEAFLVGHFPHNEVKSWAKNLANRLIAKFRIPTNGFWPRGFPSIPKAALFPKDDKMENFIRDL